MGMESVGTKRRIIYGMFAAAFASLLLLDATVGSETGYPLYHKLFDGDWQIARNMSYVLLSVGAAIFSYLTANVK